MKTSPFKVMTTAALATAVAVPAVATTVDAAEVELKKIAFELDGEVQVVNFEDYVDAIVSESGDLYDFVSEASPAAIGVGEGSYVSYEALVNAIIDEEDGKTGEEVLAEVSENEDALVSEDTVAEYKEFGEDEVVAPSVDGVEASNLKQLKVNLSGNYNSEAALSAESYTLENGNDTIDVSGVSMDGDTAVLTLESAVPNQDEVDVTVDSEVTGEEVSFESIKFFDTSIPEVNSVEVTGKNVVKVKFNEPMDFGSTDEDGYVENSNIRKAFELNDGDVFVKDVEPLKNNTEANVYFYSNLDEGENTLTIGNSVKDYAGFVTVKEALEFDVVEDEEAPELVEVKDVTPLRATLVFSEDVDASTVQASDFYHTSTSLEADELVEVDGNEVTLAWDEDDALPNGTAYIYAKAESVKDLWGNENDQQLRATAEVEVDEEEPEITTVEADGETGLIVTFSEEVKTASATDEDNYSVVNEDGDEVEIDDVVVEDESENQYKVVFENNTTGGVTLTADGVEDIYGNATDDATYSLTIIDATNPDISAFVGTLYDESNEVQTLIVNFDGDKMATSGQYSVLDLEKYEINGIEEEQSDETYNTVNNKLLSDLDGVNISAADGGKKVRIELDTEEAGYKFDSNTTSISMAQVADVAGNKSQFSDSFGVSGPSDIYVDTEDDGTDKAYAVSADEIEFTLDGAVTEVDEEEFEVYGEDASGNTTSLTITSKGLDNSGSNSVVSFGLDEKLNTEGKYVADNGTVYDVYVKTKANVDDTTSEYGDKVNFDVAVTDSISPVLDASVHDGNDDGEFTVARDSAAGKQTIELEFTEDVQGSNDALGTYLTVDGYSFVAGGSTSAAGQFAVQTINNSGDTVTLEVYTDENEEFTVDLDANDYLEDADGNNAEFQDTVTVNVYSE